MTTKKELEAQVEAAARRQGMSSVLLRNTVSRKLGLNITDMECLSLLNIKGFSTPKELAHYTGMTPGAATTMLDRLEKAKFIRRMPNPTDRRGVLIKIDKEAMGRVGALFASAQQAQRELIASYSAQELEIIVNFLSRFTQNIDNHTKHIENK